MNSWNDAQSWPKVMTTLTSPLAAVVDDVFGGFVVPAAATATLLVVLDISCGTPDQSGRRRHSMTSGLCLGWRTRGVSEGRPSCRRMTRRYRRRAAGWRFRTVQLLSVRCREIMMKGRCHITWNSCCDLILSYYRILLGRYTTTTHLCYNLHATF